MFLSYQQAPHPETIPAEIVAAITAALVVYLRPGSTSWQITSIQPQTRPARRWSLAGRQELIDGALVFERRRPAV